MKRILVTGAGGMAGDEVAERAGTAGWKVRPLARADLDITDSAAVGEALEEFRPHVVVNCAGYTAVDRAESEPEIATSVNVEGARDVARAAAAVGSAIIHISTDYVFDGQSRRPYEVDSEPSPLGVYGKTKLGGEAAVLEENPASVIVRTSWLFSHRGSNFLRTMLRLGAERDEVRVVDDQVGRPTLAADLADALLVVADALFHDRQVNGTYHFANEGETSWYGFAQAIFEEMAANGEPRVPRVVAIKTSEFPTAAKRPAYSVLDTSSFTKRFNVSPRPWREALRETIIMSIRDDLIPR